MTRRKVTYGFAPQADLVASAVEVDGTGMRFAVHERGSVLGDVRIRLPGRHNVLNALATIAVTRELDVPFADAAAAMERFLGIERRFESKGEVAGISVFDDYGHHPAEIRATLASARAFHRGRVVVAFQPHRYSRTRDLWEDFVTAFNDADFLVMTEIYAAGEEKILGIESAPLVEAICAHGHRNAHFVGDLDAVVERLLAELEPGDLVLVLGAGNISTLGDRLVGGLREKYA
jgi:UDP-N-acetylmuramate--alanine ligase